MQEQNSIFGVHNQDADVSAALDFLKDVLPPEGDHWYVAAVFERRSSRDIKARVNHHWHRSRLALAVCLREEDERGRESYYACAVFGERSNGRKGENAVGAGGFWSDVDAGEGKQYASADSAQDAVLEFCRKSGLPNPLFVGSGHGLHLHWPLGYLIDPETWKKYAAGLGRLFREASIRHERTTDIASILRPPGTHNRKRGILPVTFLAEAGPYKLEQFEVLLRTQEGRRSVGTFDQHTARVNGSSAERLAAINTHGPRYSTGPLRGCGQLADPPRDSRGYVPEPIWHLGLGVFAFIEGDGDDAAHEWSADDDRYNASKPRIA
jgi:hypothetical protein